MNIATNFAPQKPKGYSFTIFIIYTVSSNKLILIYGPTCVGKTAGALLLAERYNSDIFSCDSRQIYKEMSIGTAVPSPAELARVNHHFIQEVSIHEAYSVGRFLDQFDERLAKYLSSKDLGICAGGTGLYLKAIIDGLNEFPSVPADILDQIESELATSGLEVLCRELEEKDPQYYNIVDRNNSRRVVRALAVIRASKKPFSYFRGQKIKRDNNFTAIKIALIRDREELYQRINHRVEHMIEEGLLAEVEALYPHRHLKAMQTVGYSELIDYLDKKTSLDEAVELIKRNTRRYAKRQLTWLRNQTKYTCFHAEAYDDISTYIEDELRK